MGHAVLRDLDKYSDGFTIIILMADSDSPRRSRATRLKSSCPTARATVTMKRLIIFVAVLIGVSRAIGTATAGRFAGREIVLRHKHKG